MHLLIVEDDEATRQSIKGWLSGKKHTAVWCTSGRSALEAMHRESFDLVLLDMVLEGVMTGWDVVLVVHSPLQQTTSPLRVLKPPLGDPSKVPLHTPHT